MRINSIIMFVIVDHNIHGVGDYINMSVGDHVYHVDDGLLDYNSQLLR